jgi:hypothetical protein
MLFYRKNIGGCWETKKISLEESKKVQLEIMKLGLKAYANIKNMAKVANIEITEEGIAAILDKAVPTYDSLANDLIEESLIAKPTNPQ